MSAPGFSPAAAPSPACALGAQTSWFLNNHLGIPILREQPGATSPSTELQTLKFQATAITNKAGIYSSLAPGTSLCIGTIGGYADSLTMQLPFLYTDGADADQNMLYVAGSLESVTTTLPMIAAGTPTSAQDTLLVQPFFQLPIPAGINVVFSAVSTFSPLFGYTTTVTYAPPAPFSPPASDNPLTNFVLVNGTSLSVVVNSVTVLPPLGKILLAGFQPYAQFSDTEGVFVTMVDVQVDLDNLKYNMAAALQCVFTINDGTTVSYAAAFPSQGTPQTPWFPPQDFGPDASGVSNTRTWQLADVMTGEPVAWALQMQAVFKKVKTDYYKITALNASLVPYGVLTLYNNLSPFSQSTTQVTWSAYWGVDPTSGATGTLVGSGILPPSLPGAPSSMLVTGFSPDSSGNALSGYQLVLFMPVLTDTNGSRTAVQITISVDAGKSLALPSTGSGTFFPAANALPTGPTAITAWADNSGQNIYLGLPPQCTQTVPAPATAYIGACQPYPNAALYGTAVPVTLINSLAVPMYVRVGPAGNGPNPEIAQYQLFDPTACYGQDCVATFTAGMVRGQLLAPDMIVSVCTSSQCGTSTQVAAVGPLSDVRPTTVCQTASEDDSFWVTLCSPGTLTTNTTPVVYISNGQIFTVTYTGDGTAAMFITSSSTKQTLMPNITTAVAPDITAALVFQLPSPGLAAADDYWGFHNVTTFAVPAQVIIAAAATYSSGNATVPGTSGLLSITNVSSAVCGQRPSMQGGIIHLTLTEAPLVPTILAYQQGVCEQPGFTDCADIYGAPQTTCLGYSSKAFGSICNTACDPAGTYDPSTLLECDRFARNHCAVGAPAANSAECSCVNIANSTYPVPILGSSYSYTEFLAKFASTFGGDQLPQVLQDTSCWWPTCTTGALRLSTQADSCPPIVENCFAVIENVDVNNSKNVQILIDQNCSNAAGSGGQDLPSGAPPPPIGKQPWQWRQSWQLPAAVGIVLLLVVIGVFASLISKQHRR